MWRRGGAADLFESKDDHGARVVAVRLWDKPRTFDLLFRHLGLLKDAVHVQGPVEIRWRDLEERLHRGRAEFARR